MAKPVRGTWPQRRFVRSTSKELVPNAGDELEWVSPLVGRFALANITHSVTSTHGRGLSYYDIMHHGPLDEQANVWPITRYFYTSAGALLGVVKSTRLQGDNDWAAKIARAVDFQLEHGLYVPNGADYDTLVGHLRLAQADAIPPH